VFQTEQSYRANPKFLTQIQYCEDNGIPLAVVIGEDEISKNIVKIRNVVTKAEVLLYFAYIVILTLSLYINAFIICNMLCHSVSLCHVFG